MKSKNKTNWPEKGYDFFGNSNFIKQSKYYFMRFLVFVITGLIFCQTAFSKATVSKKHHKIKRGFTITKLDDGMLKEIKQKWSCNIVRLVVRPAFLAKHIWHVSTEQAWKRFIKELPKGLDNAKKYDITVVIALFGVPTEKWKSYPKERDASSGAFWADENNLKVRIDCWKDIAEVCKNRKQDIWFDLFNEPLNWQEMPKSPSKWPRWAQAIIDEIRKIDTEHHIVIEPGPGGLNMGFKDFPLLKDPKLIYSVHQYTPHSYTHQLIGKTENTDLAQLYKKTIRWPNPSKRMDKKSIEDRLKPVVEFQKKHGVRIYVGEFSVVRWAPGGYRYLRDCIEIFEKNGWDWTYHGWKESPVWSLDYGDSFGKSKISKTPNWRARVVKRFMQRNRTRKKARKTSYR